jgi:hypothetical protein
MIQSMTRLDFPCVHDGCEVRADIEVRRTNDELPSNYVQSGMRALTYCKAHIPEDVRRAWGFEEADAAPFVEPWLV